MRAKHVLTTLACFSVMKLGSLHASETCFNNISLFLCDEVRKPSASETCFNNISLFLCDDVRKPSCELNMF